MKKLRLLTIALLFLSVLITAIATVISFAPTVYGYVKAPKFSSIKYDHTGYSRETMCLFICKYTPLYNYRGEGTQKELVTPVIDALKKEGFKLENSPDSPDQYKPDVRCFGKAGDRYYFEKKGNGSESNSQFILISFYSDSDIGGGNTSNIGCDRPKTKYRIEITPLP